MKKQGHVAMTISKEDLNKVQRDACFSNVFQLEKILRESMWHGEEFDFDGDDINNIITQGHVSKELAGYFMRCGWLCFYNYFASFLDRSPVGLLKPKLCPSCSRGFIGHGNSSEKCVECLASAMSSQGGEA